MKVPARRLGRARSAETVAGRGTSSTSPTRREMKGGLDEVSLPNFVAAAAWRASSARARRWPTSSYLCGIHMKRSMHEAIVGELGMPAGGRLPRRHRPHERRRLRCSPSTGGARGRVADGDPVLLLAAGTGYTWAASVVRWGTSRAG